MDWGIDAGEPGRENDSGSRSWCVAQRQAFELLRAGRGAEAETVFRGALAAKPRDGRLLFGLAKSLRAQGREGDASLVERQLAAAWDSSARALRVEDL